MEREPEERSRLRSSGGVDVAPREGKRGAWKGLDGVVEAPARSPASSELHGSAGKKTTRASWAGPGVLLVGLRL